MPEAGNFARCEDFVQWIHIHNYSTEELIFSNILFCITKIRFNCRTANTNYLPRGMPRQKKFKRSIVIGII